MTSPAFDGKVIIVTGASFGIGRETAVQFAAQGGKVAICGRNLEKLEETKNFILENGAAPENVLIIQGDITEDGIPAEIVAKTVEAFGKLDIVINNAGGAASNVFGLNELDSDISRFDYAMNLNCRSILLVCQHAFPHLKKTSGCIVNVSSVAGLPNAAPHFPFYSCSKAALDQISRSLASYYAQHGVRLNCINPGVISSNILQNQGVPNEVVATIESNLASNPRRIPLGRAGSCKEIADAILYLADNSRASYVVGAHFRVDGGTSLHNPFLAEGYTKFAAKP